ncbi:hypothetical protein GPNCGGLF_LOCUS433 [Methylorubrum aminovorans]
MRPLWASQQLGLRFAPAARTCAAAGLAPAAACSDCPSGFLVVLGVDHCIVRRQSGSSHAAWMWPLPLSFTQRTRPEHSGQAAVPVVAGSRAMAATRVTTAGTEAAGRASDFTPAARKDATARKELSGQNVSLSKTQGCSANTAATDAERPPWPLGGGSLKGGAVLSRLYFIRVGCRPNSSSASHNSNGAALPPRSITTCLKLASPDAPGVGMETLSPIARMTPCNSTGPKAISTVVPNREEQLISADFSDILDQRNARAGRSGWRPVMLNEGLLNRTLRTTRTDGPV